MSPSLCHNQQGETLGIDSHSFVVLQLVSAQGSTEKKYSAIGGYGHPEPQLESYSHMKGEFSIKGMDRTLREAQSLTA